LIFSVIAGIVFLKTDQIGFLSSVALFIFVILAGRLDVPSGLRAYHFAASSFMWIALLLVLLGLGYLFFSKRESLVSSIKSVLLYSVFVGLIYLPWPIKNYSETGKLSFIDLLKMQEQNRGGPQLEKNCSLNQVI